MDKKTAETEKDLVLLNKQLAKLNSYSYQFFLSIVRGVGTALGATIIFSIVIAILAGFLKNTDFYPTLENIFSNYNRNLPLR